MIERALPGKESPQEWIMYFDGAFSLQGAGAGVLLIAPSGEHLKYVVQMHFAREEATNNTAEYEGLLAGLRIAAELGIKKLFIRGDSQLVVRQVNKDYQSPLMEAYVEEVRRLEERFDGLQTEHVPMRKTALLIIYQIVLSRNFLWKQELLFSILLSPLYPRQQWPRRGGNKTQASL